jgi:DNA-binding transcriptional ArsR family regulator
VDKKLMSERSDSNQNHVTDQFSPELEKLMCRAEDASHMLKAISHESRLMVLCLLSERERSVSELEHILALRQPTVSQQLARLREENLVKTRRDGNTIYYSLANEEVRKIINALYEIFCSPGNEATPGAAP